MFFRTLIISILVILFAKTAPAAKSTSITRLGHAIQMGAFAEVKNAERFTTRLQSKGLEAFYFRKDNGFYAVRFGDFPSKEKAQAVAKKLVAARLIDSYYIAPPNEIVFSRPKEPGWQKQQPDEIRLPQEPKPAVTPRDIPDKPQPDTEKNEKDMGAIAARTA
ncbi:MAG: SPOR domain-containing protein, partial [Saprospiraceae bacterium]|nr:SPOR domain-containing protein [Saprospiraceae bacterium]